MIADSILKSISFFIWNYNPKDAIEFLNDRHSSISRKSNKVFKNKGI